MLVIRHRVNALEQLTFLPQNIPVEVDIHAFGERLVIHHDAMKDGPDLADWLAAAGNRFAILNVKEEGIEDTVLAMAENSDLEDFFLLDLSFPALMKMIRKGEKRVALRVSEYEHFSAAVNLHDKVGWVWLDCFDGFPLDKKACAELVASGVKICLVSPELHGPPRSEKDIISFKLTLLEYDMIVDAVCTKMPEVWLG